MFSLHVQLQASSLSETYYGFFFLQRHQASSFTWDQEHTVAAVGSLATPF
jgi:hypothetical protein